MSGNLRSGVDPVYPVEARQKKLEGAIVIDTLIGKDGAVETLKVVSGPAIFAGAASDAVRQWVYKPFYLNGQPTEVRTTVTVNFRLASSSPPR